MVTLLVLSLGILNLTTSSVVLGIMIHLALNVKANKK